MSLRRGIADVHGALDAVVVTAAVGGLSPERLAGHLRELERAERRVHAAKLALIAAADAGGRGAPGGRVGDGGVGGRSDGDIGVAGFAAAP